MTTSNAAVRVNEASDQPAESKDRQENKAEKRKAAPRKKGPKREAMARFRDIMGWTQANLSAHIGASRSYVCRTENHRSTPEPGMRDVYAKALKITVAELDLLLANKISLDDIDEFAAKVARRSVDELGNLVFEDEGPRSDNADKEETAEHAAVVVMLYPKGDSTLPETADNDASLIEAPLEKTRPALRLIDCTQLHDEDDDESAPGESMTGTTVVTAVDQPALKAVRPRAVSDKARSPRARKPKAKSKLGQLPLFEHFVSTETCSPPIRQAAGG
ncbi:MAG: helix-turn-helix transcriptional regulator [Myxococcota bacterium]